MRRATDRIRLPALCILLIVPLCAAQAGEPEETYLSQPVPLPPGTTYMELYEPPVHGWDIPPGGMPAPRRRGQPCRQYAPSSEGQPHYHCPQRFYGVWYRPRTFGLGLEERTTEDPFRPRGYGNLFARPHTCYRMEYDPYPLADPRSIYGPSYLRQYDTHRWPVDDQHY
ncbi:MAG: hypothetical protein ACREJB_10805, partial [Planctomycetaceae bacterium]